MRQEYQFDHVRGVQGGFDVEGVLRVALSGCIFEHFSESLADFFGRPVREVKAMVVVYGIFPCSLQPSTELVMAGGEFRLGHDILHTWQLL